MPEYTVLLSAYTYALVVVEAENEDEAAEMVSSKNCDFKIDEDTITIDDVWEE